MKHLVSLLVPAFLLAACSAPPLKPRAARSGNEEVHLAIRDSGPALAGHPTLVLLHGWCCDQGFFDDLRPALEAEHRVVSFDFPGHGATTGLTEEATLQALAAETAGLLESLGLEGVVLVGHSMGAPVALLTADLAPERVRAIIALDALHDLGKNIDRENLDRLIHSYEADFEGTMRYAVESMFEPGVSPALVEETWNTAISVDQAYALELMASFVDFEPIRAVRSADRPLFALQAKGDKLPATAVEANSAVCRAGYEAEFVDGVRHFFLRTQPERTARGILEFVSRLENPASD